jgi:hypothetical protein
LWRVVGRQLEVGRKVCRRPGYRNRLTHYVRLVVMGFAELLRDSSQGVRVLEQHTRRLNCCYTPRIDETRK